MFARAFLYPTYIQDPNTFETDYYMVDTPVTNDTATAESTATGSRMLGDSEKAIVIEPTEHNSQGTSRSLSKRSTAAMRTTSQLSSFSEDK